MTEKHESSVLTYSPQDAIDARKEIFELMNTYQSTDEEKERSLGLFLRGSLLARFLAISDIYQLIVDIPGVILDIGTWRGQTAVICENLRAIFEPLHFNRRIICFDTEIPGQISIIIYGYDDRKSHRQSVPHSSTMPGGQDQRQRWWICYRIG